MLTRLEVDGFKNLHDFKADFGPYTCVVGKNAIGKSNMFDAIAFLSHLTKETFSQAAVHLRAEQGDIQELFGRKDQAKRFMSFAAEMIVPPHSER
ncbi:AAA family ATPase [Corynebacterium diphtheriae bv. mitis]|nr:AAA family ATPase [Corynebacterium diphtheriae bv. mitis]UWE87489.1 AAA family ATPase [Corynebacterium diphtheriae bv. mitis]UWE92666.1 AAA family ATPase [Corynebacterium diphtheriae bv. mitis]